MKIKKLMMGMLCCMLVCHMPVQAATYTKRVQYYNPTFYYNNAQKDLDGAVIVIDGVTYVPVRDFSYAVGLDFSWDGNSTLVVNGASSNDLSTQMALQAKEYEIASLKKELKLFEGNGSTTSTSSSKTTVKYTPTEGIDILGTELTETEKILEEVYEDYFEDITFEFSVRLSSSKLRVHITYETSSENREFNKLSNREIKAFVEEVCESIRDRHEDIVIDGTIKYEGNNATKYYFDYSKRDKLSYSTNGEYDDEYDDEVSSTEIERLLSGLSSITIDDYSGTITLTDKQADVNEDRDRVSLKVYADLNDAMKTALNSNKGTNNDSDLKYYLKDFAKRIYRDTDYEDIFVYLYSNNKEIAYYDYEEDDLYVYGI